MADIIPSVIANAIMGKLYDVLTNGDTTVPKATDSFFSWCTPGIPVDAEDFRFLSQGLTGVVTAKAAASLAAVTAPPSGGEEIAAFISQVMQRDMSMLKQQYQQDLVNATLTGISSGSDFLYTALVPGDFVQSAGWSTFWFNIGDFSRYANSSFSNSGWQAQAGASFLGLFGGGSASGSQSRVQSNSGVDSSNFSLRFSICQIPIVRSWFKDAYLLSKCWRFDQTNPDYKNLLVSDGGKPPKGYMPAYPTSVVFIKDLYLTINRSSGRELRSAAAVLIGGRRRGSQYRAVLPGGQRLALLQ